MYKYLFPLLLFFSCQNTENKKIAAPEIDLDREIKMLDTPKKLADYYEVIYRADQDARNAATAAQQTHGYNSGEHIAAERVISETDKLNLLKIEKLFEIHGYPDVFKLGEVASAAPWLVIHHASELGDRLHNWKIIKAGYNEGQIDDKAMSMYLNRTYEYANNGERLRMQGTFKPQEQVDSLLTLLELEL